jgi:hypothetical protein
MTQQVLREEKPPCFGRVDEPAKNIEGWNPQSPSCFGGADPTFTNEATGSHIRDRCIFFSSCGSVVQAKRMETARAIIDPKSLVRPTYPQPAPAAPTMAGQPPSFMNQFGSALVRQQQAEAQQRAVAAQPQWAGQPVPGHYPGAQYQQMMPVNHYMPSYLSTPEPVQPGGFWRMLGVTVFRSMGKSAGHSVAHLFDTVALLSPKPQDPKGG